MVLWLHAVPLVSAANSYNKPSRRETRRVIGKASCLNNACPCSKSVLRNFEKEVALTKMEDVRVFVYVAIVHHNHRVWEQKWLHLIQGMLNEFQEPCSVKSAFNNIAMEDTLFKRQCRENRIPGGSRYVNLYSMDDAITLTFSLNRRRLSM